VAGRFEFGDTGKMALYSPEYNQREGGEPDGTDEVSAMGDASM
jgi:hypothetical protein